MSFLKKLPIPISGLMLGSAALGNLVRTYGEVYRDIFGLISMVIFVLLVAKFLAFPKSIAEGFSNPVVAGVMGTFPMGMMILSTYIKPYSSNIALAFWLAGIAIHLGIIVAFSLKYLLKFNIKKVFTVYYIIYVGIVAASVSAPAHDMLQLGQYLFWFGFIAYLILLPIVIYRLAVVKEIPPPAMPTLIVQAAPASLCLAGYLSAFESINPLLLGVLVFLAVINLLFAIYNIPRLLMGTFVPAFSAFTFPIIISAIALKMTNGYLVNTGSPIPILGASVKFLEALSVFMVIFVLFRYIQHMIKLQAKLPSSESKAS